MGQTPIEKELETYKGRCDSLSYGNGVFLCAVTRLKKELADAQETIKTKDIIIKQLNRRLSDIGAQC